MLDLQTGVVLLSAGNTFHGCYEVISCIKVGGMGAVYQVLDHRTRRRRALKIMLPSVASDPDFRARFKLEATITSEIDSEHVVETFDAGVDEDTGAPFLVMELLKGEDVAGILARRGRIPADLVVHWLYQVALALERTHAAGVIHRDLKPENLFVTTRDDGSPRLKVLDFGIAKLVAHGSLAATTRNMGTPLYMSPEQIEGESTIGPRADLYALGHIAYTLLVGQGFWTDEWKRHEALFAFFGKVLLGPPESAGARAARSGVALSPAFDAWFARATAVDASARHASAMELVTALADALAVPLPAPHAPSVASSAKVGTSSVDAPRVGRPRLVSTRARTWMAVASVVAACVVATLTVASWRKPARERGSSAEPTVVDSASPPAPPSAAPVLSSSAPSDAALARPPKAPASNEPKRAAEKPPQVNATSAVAAPPPSPRGSAPTTKSAPIDPTDTR